MKSVIHPIKNKFLAQIKDARFALGTKDLPVSFVHKNVPYFCQWESRELAQDILEHKIEAGDDPKWRDSGAESQAEYTSWSWNGCGMACTKMLIAHTQKNVIPLVTLGKLCLQYGGYKEPLEAHPGLFYEPYIKFLSKEFKLQSKAIIGLSVSEIIKALSMHAYVIASVSPEIRYEKNKPKQKSGHLILILGYDLEEKKLLFHNPSGTNKINREYAVIGFEDFNRFFNHRGIIITE